jgi:RNA polymerase sigma-70 factor (ECF subfamily)
MPAAFHLHSDLAPAAEPHAADPRVRRDAALVELLHSAAQGHAGDFERFYDATVAYAHTLGRRMLSAADVDDVVADAYFQAWRELRHYDPARGSPVTWLLTIVRSRALDLLRRQRASPEVAGEDDAMPDMADAQVRGPLDLLACVQAETRLHRALATLSAQERWVLGLAYYRELTHREVCEATGLPLGTVKSLILRAQAKLRQMLGDST